jgi:hypothetical protein
MAHSEWRITNYEFPIQNPKSKIQNPGPDVRYEVKIPLPAHLLGNVLAWVRLHPAHWRVAYPPRQVNNVYFDTATFTGLNANVDGVGERAKLRLRWYGNEMTHITDAHLELKRKQGMAGWKESAAVEGDFDLTTATWPAFRMALRWVTSPAARLWLERFTVPALINTYHRAYYATPDGVLRLTVDTDLRTYDQRASNRPNLRRPALPEAIIVVELKASTSDDAARRLSDALAHFPAPVDRFSKYVQGMQAE